jgi:hypothetical protein
MMDLFWTHLNSYISNLVGGTILLHIIYYVINDGNLRLKWLKFLGFTSESPKKF